jgi:Na+-transporting NADH:ubiquinone oxidoreductase subunit NqrB
MRSITTLVLATALGLGMLYLAGSPVQAAQCMKAGGWGTGALEGFASFMAEAAMKNSAKAKLGTDDIKVGAVNKKCEQKGLLIECVATAKICK